MYGICAKCDSVYCSACAAKDDIDAGRYCEADRCEMESLCVGCRMKEDDNECWSCRNLMYPKLLAEKMRLVEENKRVIEEKERLAKENEQLRQALEEMQMK